MFSFPKLFWQDATSSPRIRNVWAEPPLYFACFWELASTSLKMCDQQRTSRTNIGLGTILVTFSEASQCGNTGGDRVLNVRHRRSLHSYDSVFARSNSQNFLWHCTSSGREEDFAFPARMHPCNNVRMNSLTLNYKQLRLGCGLLQKLSWTLKRERFCLWLSISFCDMRWDKIVVALLRI